MSFNKWWCIQPYVVMTWSKLLTHITTWVNPEGIMLSERSHAPKVACCMIVFAWHSQKIKTIGMENRWVVARDWGTGEDMLMQRQHEGAETILYPDCAGGYINPYICETSELIKIPESQRWGRGEMALKLSLFYPHWSHRPPASPLVFSMDISRS